MKTLNLAIIAAVYFSTIGASFAYADEQYVASIVSEMVNATRSTYDSLVIKKLQNNGTGSSANPSSHSGFVPETDAFLRRMTFDAIAKNKRSTESNFRLVFAPGGSGELTVKIKSPNLSESDEALIIAKVLDGMIRSIRATYTAMVVRKLQKDGFGASLDYSKTNGYVPLPAVFVRNIATTAIAARTASDNGEFGLTLRSRWNLNSEQSLRSKFDVEGWTFLVNQQSGQVASGQSLRNYVWTPYIKTEKQNGKTTLRYLSADTAANQSCVSCHNKWEARDDTKAIRLSQGIEVGKNFTLHELMGAVSISVALATAGTN